MNPIHIITSYFFIMQFNTNSYVCAQVASLQAFLLTVYPFLSALMHTYPPSYLVWYEHCSNMWGKI